MTHPTQKSILVIVAVLNLLFTLAFLHIESWNLVRCASLPAASMGFALGLLWALHYPIHPPSGKDSTNVPR